MDTREKLQEVVPEDYQHVAVSVPGRYMLEDKREFPCRTVDFSLFSVSLVAPVRGAIGERIVVYLDYVGRLEGTIIRETTFGFAIALILSPLKREKVADLLTWFVNREILEKADRRHERIVPALRHSLLSLEPDREHLVRLIDLSVSGAAITSDLDLPLATKVNLGSRAGHIVRHFEGGFAIEFDTPIPIDEFGEDIRL